MTDTEKKYWQEVAVDFWKEIEKEAMVLSITLSAVKIAHLVMTIAWMIFCLMVRNTLTSLRVRVGYVMI